MVLINNLTIDEINAALLHLQRSKTEVVGGVKGDTIQNITIQNSGGGSSAPDFTTAISIIQNRLEELGLKDEDLQNQINNLVAILGEFEQHNVVNLRYDETTRELYLDFENGDFLSVQLPSDEITLSLDEETNELTISMGTQTKSVILPYINANEKGVAGGVATLDETGRVPYSQLPESAMEFKGEWDASTNTPTLADGTGVNGDFYIVSAGGTVNFGTQAEPREVTFYPNDRVIYNGDSEEWVRLPAGSVVSVNGMSGAVVLTANNIMYDSTQTIKQKIDDAAQADWTEQNSSSPSFIKHKIPIWITGTGADDNVTPIDSVTSGSMRPVTSNAVAQEGYLTSADITDQVTVNNMQSVSSNAVADAISYSETEHQVGYWIDGKPLYEKTVTVRTSSNGSYSFTLPLNHKIKRWFGNYFHISIDNPSFIMQLPYTYVEGYPIYGWIMIYAFPDYTTPNNCTFNLTLSSGGSYTSYFNGYCVVTYQYTKT